MSFHLRGVRLLFSRIYFNDFSCFEIKIQGRISRTIFLFKDLIRGYFTNPRRSERFFFSSTYFNGFFPARSAIFFFQGAISRTFCPKFLQFKDLIQGIFPISESRTFFSMSFFNFQTSTSALKTML